MQTSPISSCDETSTIRRTAVVVHSHAHTTAAALGDGLADRARLRDDRGDVTPRTIMVFVFAALALTVGTIITTKVTGKANAIQVD